MLTTKSTQTKLIPYKTSYIFSNLYWKDNKKIMISKKALTVFANKYNCTVLEFIEMLNNNEFILNYRINYPGDVYEGVKFNKECVSVLDIKIIFNEVTTPSKIFLFLKKLISKLLFWK